MIDVDKEAEDLLFRFPVQFVVPTRQFPETLPIGRRVFVGSLLKFCRLAAGQANVYPRLGRTMKWDTAGGDAVLRVAVGSIGIRDGREFAYGPRIALPKNRYENPEFIAFGGPFERLKVLIAECAGSVVRTLRNPLTTNLAARLAETFRIWQVMSGLGRRVGDLPRLAAKSGYRTEIIAKFSNVSEAYCSASVYSRGYPGDASKVW